MGWNTSGLKLVFYCKLPIIIASYIDRNSIDRNKFDLTVHELQTFTS